MFPFPFSFCFISFRCQIRAPFTRFFFLSIASIFNYVSMRKTVGEFYVLNGVQSPSTPRAVSLLYPVLHGMMKEDNFEFDEETKVRKEGKRWKGELDIYHTRSCCHPCVSSSYLLHPFAGRHLFTIFSKFSPLSPSLYPLTS